MKWDLLVLIGNLILLSKLKYMSKLIKYYSKIGNIIINLESCNILQDSIPISKDIIRAIKNKETPLYIYTENDLWKKIKLEVEKKAKSKLKNSYISIFLGDTNTHPVCLIGEKTELQRYQEILKKE